jgi:hypothetical protein
MNWHVILQWLNFGMGAVVLGLLRAAMGISLLQPSLRAIEAANHSSPTARRRRLR